MKDTHFTIEDPGRDEVQAVFLKAALKMIRIGLKPARNLTKTKLMARASQISGVKYKRNEINKAIEDMETIIRDHLDPTLPAGYNEVDGLMAQEIKERGDN